MAALERLRAGLLLGSLALFSVACGSNGTGGAGGAVPPSATALLDRYRAEHPLPERLEATIQSAGSAWVGLKDREQLLLGRYRRSHDAKTLLELGMVYTQAEQLDLGLACLAACGREANLAAEVATWAAQNRLSAQQLEEARILARHALELNPEQATALAVLGRVDLALGQRDPAAQELARAAELLPGDANLALDAARLAEEDGKLEDAARWLDRALRRDPENPALLYRLGNLRETQGYGLEAKELLKRHERALLIDDLGLRGSGQPREVVACAIGVHFDQNGQPAKAYPEFQWARAHTQDRQLMGTVLAGVALTGSAIGELGEAQRALQELRVLDPENTMLPKIEAAFRKLGVPIE